MARLLRGLAALLGVVALAVAALLAGARFADGPLAIVAGGPFRSGELVTGPEPDWSFARELREVEFQLVEPPRSRTTWILEHEGRIFIPCGYMNSTWGRLWKQWPLEAERDGRAILRIDGELHERTLVRISDGPLVEPLLVELGRKYGTGAPIPREYVTSGSLWLFELAPR